jgi:hypothetical protein
MIVMDGNPLVGGMQALCPNAAKYGYCSHAEQKNEDFHAA